MPTTIKPKTLREAIQNIIRSGKYPTIKSDKDFAHALNIKPTTLSNYLNGRLKIGKTLSEKFKLKFHLSLHDMALFSRSAESFFDVATSDELKLFMRVMTKEELYDYAKQFRDMAVKQSDIITDRSRVIHDLEEQREQAMALFFKLEKQMTRWAERIIELEKTVYDLKGRKHE